MPENGRSEGAHALAPGVAYFVQIRFMIGLIQWSRMIAVVRLIAPGGQECPRPAVQRAQLVL